MWTKRCVATCKSGHQCKRRSIWATWCFAFQGERYKTPTWVETCSHHLDFTSVVTTMDIRHHTRKV